MRSLKRNTSPRLWFLLATTLAPLACTTGQTGGEVDAGKNPGEGIDSESECLESEREDLAPDTITDLGVSAEQLISIIEGHHESTLLWSPSSRDGVTVEPAASTQAVSFEISVNENALSYVRHKSADDGERAGEETLAGESPCGDTIEIEAEVRIRSDNGAFDDTLTTVFRGNGETMVSANIPLNPADLAGTFKVALENKDARLHGTALNISFALGTLSGHIEGGIEVVKSGATASSSIMEYGRFPVTACESGALVDPEGEWAQDFQEELDGATSFSWSWQEGEDTTLTVSSQVQSLCLETNSYLNESIVSAALKTEARSEDGRIDSTWDLSATVDLDVEGKIQVVSVYRDAYLADTLSREDFEPATGIVTESNADTLSFQFGYVIDLRDDLQASGGFAVLEVSESSCSEVKTPSKDSEETPSGKDDQGSEPDIGSSSPGCSGSDFIERDVASFIEN